jgi:hypothetical protein
VSGAWGAAKSCWTGQSRVADGDGVCRVVLDEVRSQAFQGSGRPIEAVVAADCRVQSGRVGLKRTWVRARPGQIDDGFQLC